MTAYMLTEEYRAAVRDACNSGRSPQHPTYLDYLIRMEEGQRYKGFDFTNWRNLQMACGKPHKGYRKGKGKGKGK